MRLLLVRHGQSEWNADKRLQGQADIALSGKGIRQAQTLAATINRLAPAHVLTSDLKRARHTAELLGYPDAEAGSGLREVHVGDWQGQRIADIIAADEARYLGWRAGTHTPPNGENWAQFVARTSSTIEAQREKHVGQTILAVCHGTIAHYHTQATTNSKQKTPIFLHITICHTILTHDLCQITTTESCCVFDHLFKFGNIALLQSQITTIKRTLLVSSWVMVIHFTIKPHPILKKNVKLCVKYQIHLPFLSKVWFNSQVSLQRVF